jgi:hypothetical protein
MMSVWCAIWASLMKRMDEMNDLVVVVLGNGVMVVYGSFNDGVEVLFCGQEEPPVTVACFGYGDEEGRGRKITVGCATG